MTANGANMNTLWSSSARNDVIFIFSFCRFLPCTKVFLPAGKIMVKSPVITPHGKNLTTLKVLLTENLFCWQIITIALNKYYSKTACTLALKICTCIDKARDVLPVSPSHLPCDLLHKAA